MPWFKNTETGLVWEVTGEDTVKRCENDSNYEEVAAPNEKPKRTKSAKVSDES